MHRDLAFNVRLTVTDLQFGIGNQKPVILVNTDGKDRFSVERAKAECVDGVSDMFKPYAYALANVYVRGAKIEGSFRKGECKTSLVQIVEQYCDRSKLHRDLVQEHEQQKQKLEIYGK